MQRYNVAGVQTADQADKLFRLAARRGYGRLERPTGNRSTARFMLTDE
jgi:hypothetical protein